MAIREHYRELTIEALGQGAPVGDRFDDQCEVTVLMTMTDYIIGVYRNTSYDEWSTFKAYEKSGASIVVIPAGYCKNAPVYVGDVLMDENGHRFTVEPTHTESMLAACSWPTAVPNIYPEPRDNDKLVAVLNAALDVLRSVATKDEYPAVAKKLVKEYVAIVTKEGG